MSKYYVENCKHCLPCGICELKSSFDKTVLCNQVQPIERKTCMNCLNRETPLEDFPCIDCENASNWRRKYK